MDSTRFDPSNERSGAFEPLEKSGKSLILVPMDLGSHGEPKLAEAVRYARALDADVLLLHVLAPGALHADSVSSLEAQARASLDTLAAHVHAQGVPVTTLVREGRAAEIILAEASLHGATLLILGANTRSVLRTAVLGSVADQIVRRASCPVLLVQPTAPQAAGSALRSFGEDSKRLGPYMLASVGVRTIELSRIVGSVSRSLELGRDFRPIQRRGRQLDDQRYLRVREALDRDVVLPPIKVYRIGFGYYVEDGHHRVAAAVEVGQIEIDAAVTQCLPLDDFKSAARHRERLRFEQQTGLKGIGAARPESYRVLAAEVASFAAGTEPHDPLAAGRWHASVYHPLWQRVREHQLTHYFPGDRGADIVARLIGWRAARPELSADWGAAFEAFTDDLRSAGAERLRAEVAHPHLRAHGLKLRGVRAPLRRAQSS
jgi:nucleotide-binding universal stress UspA family protein